MSFDLKINHLCPHVQTEEIHVCEADGRRVILNDIMTSTGAEALRVKVNGVEWPRNNTLESPVVFDITEEIASLAAGSSNFQMVLPEIPAMRGDQQGRFADSDQHVIIRACTSERVPEALLAERSRVFQLGQNLSATQLYVARSTAHAWGLVRPALAKVAAPSADLDAILARYDSNPNIGSSDILNNPDILRPELERILSPSANLDPWITARILERFDADPAISSAELMDGLDMLSGIADSITALIGDGRGADALFDSADTIRDDVEIALGEVRPQLDGILSTDTVLSSIKRRDMLTKYDANPAISASELTDGFDLSQSTANWITGLLGEGRASGTCWVEIPITPRLPLLGRYDFIEGEVTTNDILALVNGEPVAVSEVDGFAGTVVLEEAPYPCDAVEIGYCWKMRLLFVNGESGVVAIDPHHLGGDIANADIRFFTRVRDGWSLAPNAGSIGGQMDVVFDTTKRTDKGRAILEDVRRFANGFNKVFRTAHANLLPFDADFFSQSSETLSSSAPLSINGEITVPAAFDPELGLLQLDFAPGPGQDVRVSYYYRMADDDSGFLDVFGRTPANPFEPDIIEVDYITERTNCHRCNAMARLDDVHFSPVDGSIIVVRTERKLRQDLYKIVGTVVGSNPFHRFYGTNFTIYIGQAGPAGFFQAQLTNEMISALGALQRLQNDQFTYQAEFIDRRELMNAVQSVNVRQVDEIDPGIWQVDVTLLSDAANVVDASVLLTEEGVTLLDRAFRKGFKAIPQ